MTELVSVSIADSPHGLDSRCLISEFLSQSPDYRVDDVASALEVISPDVLPQRLTWDRLSRTFGKELHHAELQLGEGDSLAIEDDLAGGDVEKGLFLLNSQLGPGEPGEPPVYRRWPKSRTVAW